MQLACARAVELGLPGLAFTEHVDFTDWALEDPVEHDGPVTRPARVGDRPRVAPFDADGYLADLARCRDEFPDLRILSGIEAGEPHLFRASVAAVLSGGRVRARARQPARNRRRRHADRDQPGDVRQHRSARGDASVLRRTRSRRRGIIGVQRPRALRLRASLLADRTGGRLRRLRLRGGIPGGVPRTGIVRARVGDQHAQPDGVRRSNCDGGGRRAATRCRSAATRTRRSAWASTSTSRSTSPR